MKGPHSHLGQDLAVLLALDHKRGGFFVDMAANDPYTLSNTALLEEEADWKGVCIDATMRSQRHFELSNRTCSFVLALASESSTGQTSPLTFREIEPTSKTPGGWAGIHTLSSVVKAETAGTCWDRMCLSRKQLLTMNVTVTHRQMLPRSLDDILNEAHAPAIIDYLSLDVEGHETKVLRGLCSHSVRVLTIERPDREARELLGGRLGMVRTCNFSYGEELWLSHTLSAAVANRYPDLGKRSLTLCRNASRDLKARKRSSRSHT